MSIPTSYEDFLTTLTAEAPDALWPEALKALWHDGNGDWTASHNIAQELPTPLGSWIHAYLHRKEGDKWNAGYWYGKAGREFPQAGIEEEFRQLVKEVI